MRIYVGYSGGVHSPVTDLSFLCITGAVERLMRRLSRQICLGLYRSNVLGGAQRMHQYLHQRRVGVWRDAVPQVRHIAVMRVKSSE